MRSAYPTARSPGTCRTLGVDVDAIGAITSITAGVMRRIADSIDGNQAGEPRREVHYHFHLSQADSLDKPEDKGRGFTRFSRR